MKPTIGLLLSGLLAASCFAAGHPSFSVTVEGAGQPMILIPGLESPGEVWRGVIDHYQSSYRIHTLTLAGFAGAPAVPGLHLSDVKDDLIQYIRDNHMNKPVIVGHSLGGFLALWVAASDPGLVGRVISVDGLPFLPALMSSDATAAESKAQGEQMRSLYASLQPAQLESMSKMALGQMISDPKSVDTAAEWARHSDPAFVGQAVYDLMTTDLRPEMKNVSAPILLIGAGKAFASESGQLARVRAAYESQVADAPDHTVVMAEHALHFIMLDDPAFLLSAIDQFLGRR